MCFRDRCSDFFDFQGADFEVYLISFGCRFFRTMSSSVEFSNFCRSPKAEDLLGGFVASACY